MADVERDAAGYTPGQIKALKIAIAIMTSVIVAGLGVLVLTFAYRASSYKRPATPTPGLVDLHTLFPGAGSIAEAHLPMGAHVVSVTPWGDRLVLLVEDGAGTSVLALDPKTARIEPIARLQQGQ